MKGSVIHEYRPTFPQQVFSQLQRSLDHTHFVQVPPVAFFFLDSPHKSLVCAGKFGRNRLPKHAFLSHSPLASPWYVPRPNPRGAQGFRLALNQDEQQRSETVKSQVNTETLRHFVQHLFQSEEENKEHISETVVQHPPETHVTSSQIGNVVVPVMWQTRPQSPLLDLLFNAPIFVR